MTTLKAHSTLTGSDLHEPKGVSSATSGQVYVANGSGSGSWSTVGTVSFGYISSGSVTPTVINNVTSSRYSYSASVAPSTERAFIDTTNTLTFAVPVANQKVEFEWTSDSAVFTKTGEGGAACNGVTAVIYKDSGTSPILYSSLIGSQPLSNMVNTGTSNTLWYPNTRVKFITTISDTSLHTYKFGIMTSNDGSARYDWNSSGKTLFMYRIYP